MFFSYLKNTSNVWLGNKIRKKTTSLYCNAVFKSRKTTPLVPICDVCFYDSSPSAGFLQCLVRVFFGCLAAVACGMLYAVYLSTYHDRKFWFSTRQVGDWRLTLYFHCTAILYQFWNALRCVSGVGAWNHFPRRQRTLLLLLQAHADGPVIWKRYMYQKRIF